MISRNNFFILIWKVEVYGSMMVIDYIQFYELVRSQRLDATLCLQAIEEQKASKYYLEILMFPRSSQSSRAVRTRSTCFPFEPFHPGIRDTAYAESVNTEAQHPSSRSCVPLICFSTFSFLYAAGLNLCWCSLQLLEVLC